MMPCTTHDCSSKYIRIVFKTLLVAVLLSSGQGYIESSMLRSEKMLTAGRDRSIHDQLMPPLTLRQKSLPQKHIQIAAILPDFKEGHYAFSYQKVSPAINIALLKVNSMTNLVAYFNFSVEYANSHCHISKAINQAFNYYMDKKVDVFFGPCCDYAAAPIARQISYWNLPMVTAGGMAADFGSHKLQMYPLLTRVGPHLTSLVEVVIGILDYYNWRKVKLVYSPTYPGEVIQKFCHLAVHSIHQVCYYLYKTWVSHMY